jgi:hypothetical protein
MIEVAPLARPVGEVSGSSSLGLKVCLPLKTAMISPFSPGVRGQTLERRQATRPPYKSKAQNERAFSAPDRFAIIPGALRLWRERTYRPFSAGLTLSPIAGHRGIAGLNHFVPKRGFRPARSAAGLFSRRVALKTQLQS